eukprot:GFYU01002202.1.p1 GENE.GFYU01002202.1~~GFYU01002202.1.p1  ORF type:complete len:159 (-),score=63.06 GFYU01002202.1:27-503(-)
MKVALRVKIEGENVTDICPNAGTNWCMLIKCTSCGEEHQKEVYLLEGEEYEMQGSRGSAHLVCKCHFCGRENNLSIVSAKGHVTEDHLGNWVENFAIFEGRGLEPVKWIMKDGFTCKSTASSNSYDIELDDGEFCDYDADGDVSIRVFGVEGEFVKAK